MGVKIFELVPSKNIELSELSGKTIAIDAPMFLYQFLTSIRKPDGSPLTDSKGRITSHLVGLFSRAAKFVQLGIKTVFVFDGKPHSLKAAEIAKRAEAKAEAMLKFEFARAKGHIEEMAKFAPRTTRLSHEMIDEAKKLLNALGIPVVDGLSEGEAQASFMVKRQDAWAVASQDADCLVFGAPRLIRNLAASPHKGRDQPQIVLLKELLDTLGIDLPQLIALAMLVGTDYNPGGIKGIGPKKALQLVKKFGHDFVGLFDSVRWSDFFNFDWKKVFELFESPEVNTDYNLSWASLDRKAVLKLLVDEHDFSQERVLSVLDELEVAQAKMAQRKLKDFG